MPQIRGLIKICCFDSSLKTDVRPQIETVRDVLGIGKNFWLTRVPLSPFPVLFKIRVEAIAVLHTLDVASSPRIPIPVPGATYIRSRFEHSDRISAHPELVQHVHTSEAGIYNHDIDIAVFVEDVILVTEDGAEVLTSALPRTPEELEAMIR